MLVKARGDEKRVYYDILKLSVSDVVVSQKSSNGEGKEHFFWREYNFTCSLCTNVHLWAKIMGEGGL